MNRYYFSTAISSFLTSSADEILGKLALAHEFALEQPQRDAWIEQIRILKKVLQGYPGQVYFEYSIPRMGKRIDAVCVIGPAVFILEFKIGEKRYLTNAMDQVMDYALDLKNFHQTSHDVYIAPILIATQAGQSYLNIITTPQNDKILSTILCNANDLGTAIKQVLLFADGEDIDSAQWQQGGYHPTPTIVEAAMALYRRHSVEEISRSDAGARNLHQTTATISKIIQISRERSEKAICFVTGVPGQGRRWWD